jgi:hypothetical protein
MNLTPNVSPAPASPNVPIPAAPTKKRGTLFYFGLAGVVAGGICCILSVVASILYGVMSHKATPAVIALPATSLPTTTSVPTATSPPPTSTNLPVSTLAPTTQGAGGSATAFNDDFSNSNSGWSVVSTDASEASYNTSGFYEMWIKKANNYIVSTSPDNLPRPLKNILISVRAQPALGDTGEYGVVCRFQDMNNFYMAGLSGNQFFIGKVVKGEWTFLTSPEWQTLPDSRPDADGYQLIRMSCIDSFIVLEVNGISAAHVTDEELSTGDVGLSVLAGQQIGKAGYYARAAFDDFSASLP